MVDSTAGYDIDSPSYSAVNRSRPGERAPQTDGQTLGGVEGAGPEHISALLTMGAAAQEAGAYSEAEELFRRALDMAERTAGSESPALVPALTSLASARVMCGKIADAEHLATRVASVSESVLSEHEGDVAILLNDFARLCLKQCAYGVAEPLLLRLLAMKRSKGEDHPEVGTVLASLATVRQALGHHESAEQLWRRVIEIRERTLAPNHFAIATALEHLAEACAARGKIREALQLFQRGQTIRELTLGPSHPSLRTSRDRIADLQLQAEESLDMPNETPAAPAPDKYRLLATNNGARNPSPVSGPPHPAGERSAATPKDSARGIERKASVEEVAPPTSSPVAADVAASYTDAPKADPVPYRDLILSIQQEIEDEQGTKATATLGAARFASLMAALKQRQRATVIGIAVLALLGVLATVSRAWPGSHQATDSDLGAISTTPRPLLRTTGADPSRQTPTIPTRETTSGAATVSAAATPVAASRIRLADQHPTAKKAAERSERKAELTGISIPKVSSALTTGFDSIVRAHAGSEVGVAESFSVQPAPINLPSQRSVAFERDDAVNSPQRAQLIGSLPTPRYPAQLVDVQGEVRVRFDVDTMGRPVMSSVSVVSSPNTMLTAAVLKVIPGIRFVPARSGGSESKATNDVVQLGFQFRPNK